MAAEIAKQRPDFVALNEVWMLTTKDFKMDLLKSLLDSLQALGQPYELVKGATVNQEELNLNPLVDFHLLDRNAILMRTDVVIPIIRVQSRQFPTAITGILPPPLNQISIHGGYVSVDAIVRGLPLRVVAVHLIPNAGTIVQHTRELLQLAADTTTLPLVFGGDFNTTADDPSNPITGLVYQTLINAGLTDAWKLLHPDQPGFTAA